MLLGLCKERLPGRGHNAVGPPTRSANLPILDEVASIGMNQWNGQVPWADAMILFFESASGERSPPLDVL